MISVVIPTHDRISDLRKALQSVYNQTVLPVEIVVVDDGSSPPVTENIFADAPEKIKTLLLRNETSQGGNNARNRGIEAVTSEWIAFLDDDDEFMLNKIESIIQCIKENKNVDIIYNRAVINMVNESVSYLTPYLNSIPDDELFRILLTKNVIGGTSLVSGRRMALMRAGNFDENLKQIQDYELWLRCAKSGCKFKALNAPLTNYKVLTDRDFTSKSLERYNESWAYIEAKYHSDFSALTKAERRRLESWKIGRLVKKSLVVGNVKQAVFFQFKQTINNPSMKNILILIALPFGRKFIYKLLMKARICG